MWLHGSGTTGGSSMGGIGNEPPFDGSGEAIPALASPQRGAIKVGADTVPEYNAIAVYDLNSKRVRCMK